MRLRASRLRVLDGADDLPPGLAPSLYSPGLIPAAVAQARHSR